MPGPLQRVLHGLGITSPSLLARGADLDQASERRTNRIRSIKDGKFRFITADALREYVRTLEREYEEAS